MGDVIVLPVIRIERDRGADARDALVNLASSLPSTDAVAAASWADWVLMETWQRGFKIVPIEDGE